MTGAALYAGCSSAPADDGEGAGSAESAGACEVTNEQTGSPLTADELGKLNDPIAQRVLLGGCPQKLDGILTALGKAKDCTQSNITSRLVSDRSLLLGKADSFRGVLTQDCQGGTDHDAFVSIFGLSPSQSALPQDGIELIGHDKVNGVFNFYVNEGGWKFMGSSADAIRDGYTCDANGACEPKAASKARCWACHESGGINMKELNSPWHSWSNTPIHSDEAFKKFGKQLGTEQDGINMETRTENANTEWNQTRIKILKDKGAAELLRPLFCTLTMNLQATGSSQISGMSGEFFVDSPPGDEVGFSGIGLQSGFLQTDATAFAAAETASGQRFVDRNGTQLKGLDGKAIVENPSGFIFPKKGDIDQRYIADLVAQKLIDRDFVLDVLHVDFTRPIFSPTRCALLSSAPKLTGAAITADKIRDGFKTNLASDSSAAAQQLLADLGNATDEAAHNADVTAFFAACNARPKADLATDILQYNAHLKAAAKAHRTNTPDGPQGIIEFAETFATDNLKDTKAFFDPKDCTLK